MSLQDEMRTLIVRHCETLRREGEVVSDFVARACDAPADPAPQIVAAKAIAHRIKGSSGSIGFPAVSAMAAALDDRLRGLETVSRGLSPAERAEVTERLGDLMSAIAAMRPERSTLYRVAS